MIAARAGIAAIQQAAVQARILLQNRVMVLASSSRLGAGGE